MAEWEYGTDQDYEPGQPEGPVLFSHTRLKLRGWTDSMIRKLLGEPDEQRQPPDDPAGKPYRFYLAERVEAQEQTVAFKELLQQARERSEAAKKRQAGGQQKLAAEVESFEIQLPEVRGEQLRHLAREQYNTWAASVGRELLPEERAAWGDDFAQVQFLRRNAEGTNGLYQSLLKKPGAAALRRRLSERILQTIALAYPELRAECERQNKRKLFPSKAEKAARDKLTAARKEAELNKKKAWANQPSRKVSGK